MLVLPFCLPRTQVGLLPPCTPARLSWDSLGPNLGQGAQECGNGGRVTGGGGTATQLLLRSKITAQTGGGTRGFGAAFGGVLVKSPGVSLGQRRERAPCKCPVGRAHPFLQSCCLSAGARQLPGVPGSLSPASAPDAVRLPRGHDEGNTSYQIHGGTAPGGSHAPGWESKLRLGYNLDLT